MKKLLLLLAAGLVAFSCSQPVGTLGDTLNAEARSMGSSPITLVSAKTREVNLGSAFLVGVIDGTIELANYSSSKQVGVHYSVDGAAWQDAPAYYQATLANGREVWAFSFEVYEQEYEWYPVSRSVQFAVKMIANGVSYWDNNGGQDYKVSTRGSDAVYPRVALGTSAMRIETGHYGSVYPAGTVLSLEIILKHLAYAKDVKVVYTTDNWATVKTAPAYFIETVVNGQERWSASPVISSYDKSKSYNPYAESVTFCVAYTVNDVTYWDNNGGNNYTLSAGTFLE